MTRPFLTAEWRYLAMLNYEIEPALLAGRVPPGTELDPYEGRTFVSIVAFRFVRTRVLGFRVPLHEDFEEVNLRFYVRRRAEEGWRRGVVFVRELVPKTAIACIARVCFNENYTAVAMRHAIGDVGTGPDRSVTISYEWCFRNCDSFVRLGTHGDPSLPVAGSLEEFIAEHYWGYGIDARGMTLEYEVRHDPWRVWAAEDASFCCDDEKLYGHELSQVLRDLPHSAFLAEGSPVAVFPARRLLG